MHAQCAVGMQRTPGIQFRLNCLHLGCRTNLLLLLLPQRISVTLTGSFQHAPASSELLPWLPNRDRAWLKKSRKENEKVMNWNQLHTFIKALILAYLDRRDWTDISLTLILFTVPLWLTKTTCSSLSPSSAIEFTGNSIKYNGIQQIKS